MVKSQRRGSIAFTVFMVMIFITLLQLESQLALILALGVGLGFTLQKSRFCIAAALRDPMITGITELTRAVILLVGLSSLGFGAVYWISQGSGTGLKLNIYPLGIETLVGGILFGIGMVLAGGCVTGVLMRIGEGFAMQMVALGGLLLGALLGGHTQVFWQHTFGEWPGVFLPQVLGWVPTLLIEFALLGGAWKFADWWQRKHTGE